MPFFAGLDKSVQDRQEIVSQLLHHSSTCSGIQRHGAKLDLLERAAEHISFTDQLVKEVRAKFKKGDSSNAGTLKVGH